MWFMCVLTADPMKTKANPPINPYPRFIEASVVGVERNRNALEMRKGCEILNAIMARRGGVIPRSSHFKIPIVVRKMDGFLLFSVADIAGSAVMLTASHGDLSQPFFQAVPNLIASLAEESFS